MSACPLTSCVCGVASLITCTSMNSSVATVGAGAGVTQLPCAVLHHPLRNRGLVAVDVRTHIGRRRRRAGAPHRHARRVRIELVVRLDLRGATGCPRASRRRSSGPGSSTGTPLHRRTRWCPSISLPDVLAVDRAHGLVDLVIRRLTHGEVLAVPVSETSTPSSEPVAVSSVRPALDGLERRRVDAVDPAVGRHGKVSRVVRTTKDSRVGKLVRENDARHRRVVRVRDDDRAAHDDVLRESSRSASRRSSTAPSPSRLARDRAGSCHRLLHVPGVDLVPRRAGRLRDDQMPPPSERGGLDAVALLVLHQAFRHLCLLPRCSDKSVGVGVTRSQMILFVSCCGVPSSLKCPPDRTRRWRAMSA